MKNIIRFFPNFFRASHCFSALDARLVFLIEQPRGDSSFHSPNEDKNRYSSEGRERLAAKVPQRLEELRSRATPQRPEYDSIIPLRDIQEAVSILRQLNPVPVTEFQKMSKKSVNGLPEIYYTFDKTINGNACNFYVTLPVLYPDGKTIEERGFVSISITLQGAPDTINFSYYWQKDRFTINGKKGVSWQTVETLPGKVKNEILRYLKDAVTVFNNKSSYLKKLPATEVPSGELQ